MEFLFRVRLFYAVAADEEVKAAAAAVVARLRCAAGNCRWVDPRDMHVTLRYLGETPEAELPGVEERMRRAAARSVPFEIVFGGLGAFDSIDHPRVIWIGLERGLEPMRALAEFLGFDEPRPFSPHLTLGRRRGAALAPGLPAALRAEPPLLLRRRVHKISLYAGRPTSFGHAYEILSEAMLCGGRQS